MRKPRVATWQPRQPLQPLAATLSPPRRSIRRRRRSARCRRRSGALRRRRRRARWKRSSRVGRRRFPRRCSVRFVSRMRPTPSSIPAHTASHACTVCRQVLLRYPISPICIYVKLHFSYVSPTSLSFGSTAPHAPCAANQSRACNESSDRRASNFRS